MTSVTPHRLYVICFDDNRIKIGISGQILRRLRYYRQEATRNRVHGFTWWASPELSCRKDAALIEGALCRVLNDIAFDGHREWIDAGSNDFAKIIRWGEELAEKFDVDSANGMWGRFGSMPGLEVLQ